MQFEVQSEDSNRVRLKVGTTQSALGEYVDLLEQPGLGPAYFGVGSVHHIAFRVADDFEQDEYRNRLTVSGQSVTPVRDRTYFRSVYFREPGGVLFELATDRPGFTIDEDRENLGSSLMLPAWLEDRRSNIERALPALDVSSEPMTRSRAAASEVT
jgi:glyoxalase family protein